MGENVKVISIKWDCIHEVSRTLKIIVLGEILMGFKTIHTMEQRMMGIKQIVNEDTASFSVAYTIKSSYIKYLFPRYKMITHTN